MQDMVGIVRSEAELGQAIVEIAKLRERASKVAVVGNREYNPGWHTAMDLGNLLTVSKAIALAAQERKESRGGHFREDYPAKDEAFGQQNTIVRKGEDGKMQVSSEPIKEMRDELKQIIEEQQK